MNLYPATVVSLNHHHAVVRIDATGHEIRFDHDEPNALSPDLREIGRKGVISFPKAPPRFEAATA